MIYEPLQEIIRVCFNYNPSFQGLRFCWETDNASFPGKSMEEFCSIIKKTKSRTVSNREYWNKGTIYN